MKKLFITLFFLNGHFSFAQQVKVLDKEDNSVIPFVHFISSKGSLLATSNLKGEVFFSEQKINDTLAVQHLSYQRIKVSTENLKPLDTIFLEKKVQYLSEVVVEPKSDNFVTVLKGYFRSYEINDDIPKFYTDGLVEYYIMRNKIKMMLLNYRAYENEELIKREKRRTNMVVMRLATIPRIDDNSLREIIKTKKYITNDISVDVGEILKDSSIVGKIEHKVDSDKIILNMDLIKPNSSKSKTMFGYTSTILNNEVTEVYSSNLLKEDILQIKQYRQILFKHKKDTTFIKLEGIDELFITDKFYTSKKEFKKIKSFSYAFPESSSYKYEYWKNLKETNIPQLNENIEKTIKETLKLLE